MTATLSVGKAPAMTSVTPIDVPTLARGALVVPGQENAAKPERLQLSDGRGGRRPDRVGDRHRSDDRCRRARRAPRSAQAFPFQRTVSARLAGIECRRSDEQLGSPDRDLVTLDDSSCTEPGQSP